MYNHLSRIDVAKGPMSRAARGSARRPNRPGDRAAFALVGQSQQRARPIPRFFFRAKSASRTPPVCVRRARWRVGGIRAGSVQRVGTP